MNGKPTSLGRRVSSVVVALWQHGYTLNRDFVVPGRIGGRRRQFKELLFALDNWKRRRINH
jgi:hypothetical protein